MGKFSLSQLTDALNMVETINDCFMSACSKHYGEELDEILSKQLFREVISNLQQHENIQQWMTRIG